MKTSNLFSSFVNLTVLAAAACVVFITPRTACADVLYASHASSQAYGGYGVQKFASGPTSGTSFAGFSDPPTQAVEGVAFDSAGNLYVAAQVPTSTIYKITPDGTQSVFASGNGLDTPKAIAFDNADNLYVANAGDRKVRKYDSTGTFQLAFTSNGGNLSVSIQALAFDSAGILYVTFGNTIEKFSTSGADLGVFGNTNSGVRGLAFDGAGNLFATNDGGRIEKFSSDGTSHDANFIITNATGPWGLALDSAGNLLACNYVTATIQKFAPDGADLGIVAYTGSNPHFVAITDDAGKPLPLPPAMKFDATAPATPGAPIHFTAATSAGWSVQVQSSTTPTNDASWTSLADGNSGLMTETPANSGNYVLDSTAYPAGSGISFRARASKDNQHSTSAPRGPFTLHQATLSIGATLVSTSDFVHGYTAYTGDYLIYKLTFKNSGDAPARSLRVTATVPTFKYADIPVLVNTLKGSSLITLSSGDTSQLAVGATITNGPGLGGYVVGYAGYLPATATITAINDAKHFTISQPALAGTGKNTLSLLLQYGSASKQFSESDISISPGGALVAGTSSAAGNLKITWDVGDLQGVVPGTAPYGYSQYVTFSVHLTGKVAPDQDIGIGNDYSVASAASPKQPFVDSTGFLSGSPNPGCRINGPISFLLNPLATTVAPGKLITYVFSLTNRGTTPATSPVAVVEVPDYTRYADTYADGTKGAVFVGTGTTPTPFKSKQAYIVGHTRPQIVMMFPSLAAKTTVQVKVTVQAKWTDPAALTSIKTVNYGAAFLDTTQPKPTSQASQFTLFYNSASTTAYGTGVTDFYALISGTGGSLAHSLNQSGQVAVAFAGSNDGQPKIRLWKQLNLPDTQTVDYGITHRCPIAKPGDTLTFTVILINTGTSPADEVYVTDTMPDHCTYVAYSGKLLGTSVSKTKSYLLLRPDPDGHHLVFSGMHLEPKDTLKFQYSVVLDASLTLPAATAPPLLVDVGPLSMGSGSMTATPIGELVSPQFQAVGNILFTQPLVTPVPPDPAVSRNKAATVAWLDSIYVKTPSVLPLQDQTALKDLTRPLAFIPGVKRLYIHYENAGNAAATGVKLTVPLPADTAFYRAAWITPSPNANPGAMPGPPGTIAKPPSVVRTVPPDIRGTGGSITGAAKGDETGSVVFHLNSLDGKGKGDVMVELIVLASAVTPTSNHIGSSTISISDSTVASPAPRVAMGNLKAADVVFPSPHAAATPLAQSSALDPAQVPSVALMRYISKSHVVPGEQFAITLVACNFGDLPCHPVLGLTVPNNCKLIRFIAQPSLISGETPVGPNGDDPGTSIVVNASTNNNPSSLTLLPHSAGAIIMNLVVTGTAGTDIVDSSSFLGCAFHDQINADKATIHIVDPAKLASCNPQSLTQVFGTSFTQLTNDIIMVDLQKGNVVVQGNLDLLAPGDGATIALSADIASGDGTAIISGTASLCAVVMPNTNTLATSDGLIANNGFAVTSAKLGNQAVIGTTIVVSPTAGNRVAAGGGNDVPSSSGNAASDGGGNVVTVVTPGGPAVVVQGGGDLVATGGGNIVAAGGGNVIGEAGSTFVAAGTGNIVAQGGGNLVSHDGGT